jgi:hypothetical protein
MPSPWRGPISSTDSAGHGAGLGEALVGTGRTYSGSKWADSAVPRARPKRVVVCWLMR